MNSEELEAVKAFNAVSAFIQRYAGKDLDMPVLVKMSDMIKACVGQRVIAETMKEKQ